MKVSSGKYAVEVDENCLVILGLKEYQTPGTEIDDSNILTQRVYEFETPGSIDNFINALRVVQYNMRKSYGKT